jgi:protein phosphatase
MSDQPRLAAHPALDIGLATDVGRVREANEDALLALVRSGTRDAPVLVAVADGMGGHNAGEVASALAVESLARALHDDDETSPAAAPADWLDRAVGQANRTIWDAAAEDRAKEGMGTTLVAALLGPAGEVTIANVGDSRAYAVCGGRATLVTIDHTWVNQQVLDGTMSEREARYSPYRNLLTRSLGNLPEVEVDLFGDLQLEAGDALVLVSDGVSGYLDEHDVALVVRESATAQEAAERLVNEAVERGGADNATAVVVRKR